MQDRLSGGLQHGRALARQLAERALELAKKVGDPVCQGVSLRLLGRSASELFDRVQSRAALEEYRKSVATPGGVMMFRSVGVEPALSIWEVVESGAAAQSEATGRDRGRERGQEMELQEVVQRFRAAADDFARHAHRPSPPPRP